MRVGIDLGGTNIATGVVTDDFQIIGRCSLPTGASRPALEVIADMARTVEGAVKDAGLTMDDIDVIGIGCPGTPVKATGEILYSNNLNWFNVQLKEEMEKLLGKEIRIDNDANAAALGETMAGAAKGHNDAILVTLGTGVGGGIILGGKVFDGYNNAGAEIGHTTIVSRGELCTCGRRGCWEAYASVTALIRMANAACALYPDSLLAKVKKEKGSLNGKLICECWDQEDEAATKVIDDYLFYVSEGVTNMINIFQPEVVMIGGGISAQGEKFLVKVRDYVKKDVFCKQVKLPEIVCSVLGNDAGIIGAAFV